MSKTTLWEQAYDSYQNRFPNSKNNPKYRSKKVKNAKILSINRETMVLQAEYNDINIKIKELTKKKNALRREIKKRGSELIDKPDYFERPILLYVLRLESGYWYIGMSRNVDRRFKSHSKPKGGSLWTSLHKPIEIYEVRETGTSNDSEAAKMEDELTLEYARQYGTDKVRGGGYCQQKPLWPSEFREPSISWLFERQP